MQSYNILLVGNERVGKSAFVERHRTGEYVHTHKPTDAPKTTSLVFETNYGDTTLNVIECNAFFNIPLDRAIHAAIIMFDVTNMSSYKSVKNWYNLCRPHTENIVLCGNKADMKDTQVKAKNMTFHRKHSIPYYPVSARSNYNFERPFLMILQRLVSIDLVFVEAAALQPPEVNFIDFRQAMEEMRLAGLA